jgi:glycosyltransferase involved in cell wall biosynthesis
VNIVHLMASPFVGGPERQVLGMARALPGHCRSSFLSFAERGLAIPFVERARQQGHEAVLLETNAPHYRQAIHEVAGHLRRQGADLLCCSVYKPDIIGWRAARRVGIPVVAISHGWTAVTWKVRCNELLDRLVLRWMDAVVCVSAAQARRVRRALVPARLVHVIPNAIDPAPFADPDPLYREKLQAFFGRPRRHLVIAAGRLSPEKGFANLIDAVAQLVRRGGPEADLGVVIFGEGPLRQALGQQIAERGLQAHVVLAGFSTEVERYLPWCDLTVLPSYTEGMPTAVLESLAAGVPVVATAVGGTPEVLEDGVHGYLVPPGDPAALARRMADLLRLGSARRDMGQRGRQRIHDHFTFPAQAARYLDLFERLLHSRRSPGRRGLASCASCEAAALI